MSAEGVSSVSKHLQLALALHCARRAIQACLVRADASRLPLAGLASQARFGVPPADVLWSLSRGAGLGRQCPRPTRGAARRRLLGHTGARRVADDDDDRRRPPSPDDHRRRPAAAPTDGTEDRRSLPVRPPSPADVAAVTRRRCRRRSPTPPPRSSPPMNPSSASLFVRTSDLCENLVPNFRRVLARTRL
jgi:hypothetical protein